MGFIVQLKKYGAENEEEKNGVINKINKLKKRKQNFRSGIYDHPPSLFTPPSSKNVMS